MYRMGGGDDGAYRDAPSVTATYDAEGFRNPDSLTDWEIVVVGDSFTELGFLPYEDLFTTKLASALGLRVKNLGVSYTGTFTQTFYLREYGKAPSTTDAVLVFFEGNDFLDLATEDRRLAQARASGAPPKPPADMPNLLQALPKQTSLARAVYRWATGVRPSMPVALRPNGRRIGEPNADFVVGAVRVPVTLENQMPPPADALRPLDRKLLGDAIASYAATARALGLRPWLVFMPCKRRALDPFLVWRSGEPRPPFPLGIPELVQELAAANDVRFVDVMPALRAESVAGRLTYNALWDTHLNQLGSATVARVLASALAARAAGSPSPSVRVSGGP